MTLSVVAGVDAADEIHVSIDDDGNGATTLASGNGLSGMAERMAELGGRMAVPRHQPGFRIELWCPRTAG